jgi:hypothetical protein
MLCIALFYLTVSISDPTLFHTEVKRAVYLRPQSSAGGPVGGIFHQASCSHLVQPRATIHILLAVSFIRHLVRTSCGLAPPSKSIGSGQIRRNAFSAFLRYRISDSHASLIPLTFLFSSEPQA